MRAFWLPLPCTPPLALPTRPRTPTCQGTAPSYGTGFPLPYAPPRGGSRCFTVGFLLTRTPTCQGMPPRQEPTHLLPILQARTLCCLYLPCRPPATELLRARRPCLRRRRSAANRGSLNWGLGHLQRAVSPRKCPGVATAWPTLTRVPACFGGTPNWPHLGGQLPGPFCGPGRPSRGGCQELPLL